MARDHASKYIISLGTQRIHMSVFRSHNNRRYCRVWRKLNEKHHANCILATVKSPVSVQFWRAIIRREKL